MTTSHHVAIVGGGLAGLLCAARLLASSPPHLTLALYEAQSWPGGRARTTDLSGGLCNLGPHALYLGGPLASMLAGLGISTQGGDPGARPCLIDQGTRVYPLPSSPLSMIASAHLSARTKWTLSRALLLIQRGAPGDHPRTLSTRDWLCQLVGERAPHALAILEMLLRLSTYSTAFDHLRASSAHQQLQRALFGGVRYLDDGWQHLVTSLVHTLAHHPRATLYPDQKIRRLDTSTRPYMLTTASHTHHADAVVLATPPQSAARLLDSPQLARGLRATRAACLDLVCTARPAGPDMILGLHEPLYYSVHSRAAALTPGRDDLEVVHVAHYLDDDTSDAVERLHIWLDAIRPEWREELIAQRVSPAIKVMNHLPTTDAARTHALPDGLFLAGDWCHDSDELLADAVAYSVTQTVDGVLAHLSSHPHSHAS